MSFFSCIEMKYNCEKNLFFFSESVTWTTKKYRYINLLINNPQTLILLVIRKNINKKYL